MSKDAEIRDARVMGILGFGLLGAWIIGIVAAALAGIPRGQITIAQITQNPAEIWGVTSDVQRFWLATTLTWAAVISLGVAIWAISKRHLTGDEDPFLVPRKPAGGWRSTDPRLLLGALALVVIGGVAGAILISPLAGLVLAVPLAAGPITGLLVVMGRSGAEAIPGDRIILGAPAGDDHHWVATRPDMSAFLLGSPSSGKTGGVIIPNLLAWDGAAVSTSTKFDVLQETARRRLELGECWVWAPLDADFALPPNVHRLDYSPISGAESWGVASRHAHALAYSSGEGESSKVWASSAAQLIAVAIHACAISGEGMIKAVEAMKQPEWRWIRKVLEESKAADPAALTALASLEGRNQTFKADMSANVDQALSLVLSGNLVEHQGGEQLDWREFLNGRSTLWVVLPTELPHTDPAPYVNVLLADLVYAVRGVSAANGYRLPHRLLMLLDELGALCSLDNLDSLIATQRAAGMSFLLAAQSLAQIDRRYGQSGSRTIRDAVGAIVLGMGVSDDQALRDMEELVGGGVALQQRGGRKDDPKVINDESERWAKHEIAGLAQFNFYVHLKGSSRPRHVKAPYFMDAPFRQLWEGTAPVPQEESTEEEAPEEEDGRLDFAWLTRLAERGGRAMARVPALDRAANAWVGFAEDVFTRLTMPRLQLQLATAAEELKARTQGMEISHHGQGVNVAGLNSYRPLMAGEEPPTHRFSVLEDDGSTSTIEVDNWPQSRHQKARKAGLQDLGPSGMNFFRIANDTKGDNAKPTTGNEAENAADEGRHGDEAGAFEGGSEGQTDGEEAELTEGEEAAGQGHGAHRGATQGEERKGLIGRALRIAERPERVSVLRSHHERQEPERVTAQREYDLRCQLRREEEARATAASKPKPVRWDPGHASIGIDAEVIEPDPDLCPPVAATALGSAVEPQHAGAPGGAPATPQPPSERPNRYAASCMVCGGMIAAGKGLISRRVDKWVVRHADCQERV